MSLQSNSTSPLATIDERTLADHNVLRERRRTLQTISELSTQGPTFTDWAATSSKTGVGHHNGAVMSNSHAKSSRRRSLPNQTNGIGYHSWKNPSIVVTPIETSPLRRSLTDPTDRARYISRRSSNSSLLDTHRLSSRSVSRRRHSQDPPLSSIAEGTQLDPRIHQGVVYSQPAYLKPTESQVTTPPNGPSRHSEAWNAQKERERFIRGQAIVAEKARREQERQIAAGSYSSLPYRSSLLMSKAKEVYIKKQPSQAQVPNQAQHSFDNHPRVLIDDGIGYSQMPKCSGCRYAENTTPRRASSGGKPPPNSRLDLLQRSHSSASEPSWTYHANLEIGTTPHLARRSSSHMLSAAIPRDRYKPSRSMSAGSQSPSPNSTCSSNLSGNSQGTIEMKRSPSTRNASDTRFHAQPQVNSGRLEIFPALTDVPPPPLGSHPVTRNPKLRRASQSSQSSRQASITHSQSLSQDQHPAQPPTVGPRYSQEVRGIIHRENPDKRGLLRVAPISSSSNVLRKRGRTPGAGVETGTVDAARLARDKAREKMREGVRRANELEDEKEKALVKEEKNKKRTFFCGLFGK